jgi:DNA-directed RNA polymerase specialized sigma24 family protein
VTEAEIVRLCRRRFRRLAHRFSEDAAQFAFFQLWRYRESVTEPYGFLTVVARRYDRPDNHLELVPEDTVGWDTPRHELRELLDAMADLSEGRQVALTARLLGLSYGQTVDATGRSYTNLDRHTKEGRSALREALSA